MPAIQLAKLRKQCSELGDHFDNPEAMVQVMLAILDQYAERTHRTGLSGEPPPLLYTYNVPKPVIRQILLEITPLATTISNTELALKLCDSLWQHPVFELRSIAASLLGHISPLPADPILSRIQSWSIQTQEDQILRIIVEEGLSRICVEAPELLIQYIQRWLDNPNPKLHLLGLKALVPLISKAEYENIPTFFKIITPLMRSLPPYLRNDLRDLLQELAARTPIETASYLRPFLETSYNPDLAWMVRQCLPFFSQATQESMRQLLRDSTLRGEELKTEG